MTCSYHINCRWNQSNATREINLVIYFCVYRWLARTREITNIVELDSQLTVSQIFHSVGCILKCLRVLRMKKIDFFESLSVPLHLWRFICLSPFNLKTDGNKSLSPNFYRNFSVSAIVIQVLVIILSFIFLQHIISPALPKNVRTLDILTIILTQLTTLVIFWESYRKRNVQMDFLRQINSIDFILEYKIGIKPDYTKRKTTNIHRLIRWLIIDIVIFIVNFVILFIAFDISYRYWTIYYASFVFGSLRYHQITTYVDIIYYRYDQINRFINNLRPFDDNGLNANNELVKTLEHVRNLLHKYKSGSIYEKVRDIRQVCRLLSSANNNINEMFQYSIPLIIVHDFLLILINSYWILRILIKPNVRIFFLFPPLFWNFLNFCHVVSLANVCHHATEEVLFIYQAYFLYVFWTMRLIELMNILYRHKM